jgi:hypothetical protein
MNTKVTFCSFWRPLGQEKKELPLLLPLLIFLGELTAGDESGWDI